MSRGSSPRSIYPVSRIGPPDAATVDAAVSLRLGAGTAHVGVAVSRAVTRARIELRAGDNLVVETTTDLAPDRPYLLQQHLERATAPEALLLRVFEGDRMLVSHRPRANAAPGRAPQPARQPPRPEHVPTVEQLYLIGAHLQRYRHATWAPEMYWQEALRREPEDIRCNLAIGLQHLQRGEAERAVRHLRRAVAASTRLDANPRDCEAYYALGLALRMSGDLHDAYEAFGKATWDRTWQPAAFLAMAEIESTRDDVPAALATLDRALLADGEAASARDLRTALLRRCGRLDEARVLNDDALARDPLDAWAANEQRLLDGGNRAPVADSGRSTGPSSGTALDVALDYARAGLLEEAVGILGGPFAPDRDPGTLPMVQYTLGWLHERRRDIAAAARARATARSLPAGLVFPARLDDIAVLRSAMSAGPTGRAGPALSGQPALRPPTVPGGHGRVAHGRAPGSHAGGHASEPGHRRVRPVGQAAASAGPLPACDAGGSQRCPPAVRVRPAAQADRQDPR